MVRVWKTKSPLFCLRYDPLIVFGRQNHITFIFIKTMSHDLLVQMAYWTIFLCWFACRLWNIYFKIIRWPHVWWPLCRAPPPTSLSNVSRSVVKAMWPRINQWQSLFSWVKVWEYNNDSSSPRPCPNQTNGATYPGTGFCTALSLLHHWTSIKKNMAQKAEEIKSDPVRYTGWFDVNDQERYVESNCCKIRIRSIWKVAAALSYLYCRNDLGSLTRNGQL